MKKKILYFLSAAYVFLVSHTVLAADSSSTSTSTSTSSSSTKVKLYNPLGSDVSVPTLIGRVISIVVGMVGAIALLMFIYGGFLWMTSAGDKTKVENGQKTIKWAVLGLVVIFTARAILALVFSKIFV